MKKKVLIVLSDYYKDISYSLLKIAKSNLKNIKIYKVIRVPGVFEIPVTISKHINKVDGVVALGCVIKGKTPHFEFISMAVTDSLLNMSILHKKPIGNGILTCLNKKQALSRINKGKEAVEATLAVIKQ